MYLRFVHLHHSSSETNIETYFYRKTVKRVSWIPFRPKLIIMSASPSMILLNFRGVTSLQTLNARKKASSIVSSSRSGVCPKILQKKKIILPSFLFIISS